MFMAGTLSRVFHSLGATARRSRFAQQTSPKRSDPTPESTPLNIRSPGGGANARESSEESSDNDVNGVSADMTNFDGEVCLITESPFRILKVNLIFFHDIHNKP